LNAKLSNSLNISDQELTNSRQWVGAYGWGFMSHTFHNTTQETSAFRELETFIHTHLKKYELVRSKLTAPIAVADTVVTHTLKTLENRYKHEYRRANTLILCTQT
jgi:hypothetical protein